MQRDLLRRMLRRLHRIMSVKMFGGLFGVMCFELHGRMSGEMFVKLERSMFLLLQH